MRSHGQAGFDGRYNTENTQGGSITVQCHLCVKPRLLGCIVFRIGSSPLLTASVENLISVLRPQLKLTSNWNRLSLNCATLGHLKGRRAHFGLKDKPSELYSDNFSITLC